MKLYHLSTKCIAGILALTSALSGCMHEETEDVLKVPLSISASFQAYTGEISARASNPTVTIALNTTPGEYGTSGKTYQVTSTSPIAFTPETPGEALTIAGSATSTPLTIYGWLDENTPVCYTNDNITVSNGNITGVKLSPAYAYIGVRIKKDDQREAAGKYTIGSALKRIGTYSTNNNWNTEQAKPQLIGVSGSSTIKNTDISASTNELATDLPSEYFMRIAPQKVLANFQDLFTVTLPDGTTLSVPSGSKDFPAPLEPGYCYLFTVNISRDTELQIEGIEATLSNSINMTAIAHDKCQRGIYSLEDLKAFRDDMNNNNGKKFFLWADDGLIVQLYADIDLKNEEWIPIENFNESFNGNGHTISNMHISTYPNPHDAGFFSNTLKDSKITGLTINGATIGNGSSHEYVGVIAGHSIGGIIDCHVKGRIQIKAGNAAGGIVGAYEAAAEGMYSTKVIAACTVETDENSFIKSDQAGGIVGYWNGAHIAGCTAHDITFDTETTIQDGHKGGIFGYSGDNITIAIGNIAYNCKGAQTRPSTAGIGDSNMHLACYFYNVFDIPNGEWVTNSVGYQTSLEVLSSTTIIEDMNSWMESEHLSYYYEPSPTPSITGPIIHIGTKP